MKHALAIGVGITMVGAAFVVYQQTNPGSVALQGDIMGPRSWCCIKANQANYCVAEGTACAAGDAKGSLLPTSECMASCGTMKPPAPSPTQTPPTPLPRQKIVTVEVSNNIPPVAGKKEYGFGNITGDGFACKSNPDNILSDGICELQKPVGSMTSFTATPLPGFTFVGWDSGTEGGGENCLCNYYTTPKPTCEFRVPEDNVKCTAWYKSKNTIGIEIGSSTENGYVNAVFDSKSKKCTKKEPCEEAVKIDYPVTLDAVPGPNEAFGSWYEWTGECPCDDNNAHCSFPAKELQGSTTYNCTAIFTDLSPATKAPAQEAPGTTAPATATPPTMMP